jgi:hypothetical protein
MHLVPLMAVDRRPRAQAMQSAIDGLLFDVMVHSAVAKLDHALFNIAASASDCLAGIAHVQCW